MRVSDLGRRLARRLGHAQKRSKCLAGAAILAGGMMFAGSAEAAVLFQEDFEGIPLLPFVSRTGGDGTDFTDATPTGWTRDNTTTPIPTVGNEYFGFSVMDIDSWIAEAGQDRNQFTKGGVGAHGTVLVADPDQFDDQTDVGDDQFNVFISTPPISLAGVPAGKVALNFDSSFRPYDAMTGLVDVSFNGGATFTNLLTLNTANSGGDSSLTRVNETVALPIANPTGGNMIIRFGMTTGGNDWWWAVDNVRVITSEADVNGDGNIDLDDFDVIRTHFYDPEADSLEEGDVNQDGQVTELDFRIWKDAFGGGPSSVPEPSSWALLVGAGLGGAVLVRRRAR